jgi:hypothetical protein
MIEINLFGLCYPERPSMASAFRIVYLPRLGSQCTGSKGNAAALWRKLKVEGCRGCLGVISEWRRRCLRAARQTQTRQAPDVRSRESRSSTCMSDRCCGGDGSSKRASKSKEGSQKTLAIMFIVNPMTMMLKKNENTPCMSTSRRMMLDVTLMSDVEQHVPMMTEKYRKSTRPG